MRSTEMQHFKILPILEYLKMINKRYDILFTSESKYIGQRKFYNYELSLFCVEGKREFSWKNTEPTVLNSYGFMIS